MPISDKQPSFEDNVKNSFLRVKEHVLILEKELRADRDFIIKQNNQIRFLLEEIRHISAEKEELRQKIAQFKGESSIGNGGVYSDIHSLNIHSLDIHSLNKHKNQPEKTINKEIQAATAEQTISDDPELRTPGVWPIQEQRQETKKLLFEPINHYQNVQNNKESSLEQANSRRNNKMNPVSLLQGHSSIIGLKSEINTKFSSLSCQEFLTFLTVYQLEEEFEHVSYIDVSAKLGLTEGCIRTYVSSLIKKGIPLIKAKYNNKVVYLSITKDFRALNLKRELMALYYRSDPTQKTLAEGFQ